MAVFWQKRGEERPWAVVAGGLVVLLGIATTLAVVPFRRPTEPAPDRIATALAQWPAEDAMAVVRRLCSEEFGGRKAGTVGGDRAADWLGLKMRQIGLQSVAGAPEYQQPFTMSVGRFASRCS